MSVLARLEGDASGFMKAFGDGEKSLKSLESVVDSTTSSVDSSMKDAEKAFDGLGKEAEQSSDEVEKSSEESADATEKSSGRMKGALEVAGAGFAVMAAAAAAASAVLIDATMSAAAYADDILKASTVTNIGTDALQAYKYAAEVLDVPFETMQSSLGKLTKSMSAAQAGTGAQADAFAKLGVQTTNADGSLRDANAVYWEAMDALGGLANETERTATAQELFGRSGAELAPLMEAGSAGFEKLTTAAEDAGAIMSGDALNSLGAFDDKMKMLQSTTDATKNAIGLTLLPVLDTLAGEGGAAFGELNKALLDANGDLSKAGPAFGDFAKSIVSGLGDAVPMVLDIAIDLVNGLMTGLITAVPQIAASVPPMIQSLLGGLIGMLPTIITAGMNVVVSLVTGIAQALPTLIPTLVQGLLDAVSALIESLPLILDAGLQLVMGLLEGIITAIPMLIEALPTLIISIVEFIVGAIPTIIDAGLKLFLSLVDALPTIIDGIVVAIPAIIEGVLGAVLDALPLIIEAGVGLFTSLIENLPTIITEIVKAIPDIITGIIDAFKNSWPQMKQVGTDLLKGIWEGIKNSKDWLLDKIGGLADDVISGVKGFFGIHSPSRVFADIGENLGLGLVEGMESTTGMVQSAMDSLMALPTETELSFSATGAMTGGSGTRTASNPSGENIVVKQDFHIYSPVSADPLESTKEAAGLMRAGLSLAGL